MSGTESPNAGESSLVAVQLDAHGSQNLPVFPPLNDVWRHVLTVKGPPTDSEQPSFTRNSATRYSALVMGAGKSERNETFWQPLPKVGGQTGPQGVDGRTEAPIDVTSLLPSSASFP